jgi:hypothetical protein
MVKGNALALHLDAETRRAGQLGAFAIAPLPSLQSSLVDQTGDPDEAGSASGPPCGTGAARLPGADRYHEEADLPGDRPLGSGGGGAQARSINLIVKRRSALAGLEPGGVFPRTDWVPDV